MQRHGLACPLEHAVCLVWVRMCREMTAEKSSAHCLKLARCRRGSHSSVTQSEADCSSAGASIGAALAVRKGRPIAIPGGSSTAPLVHSVSQTHWPVTSSKCSAPQRDWPGHWNAALHILYEHSTAHTVTDCSLDSGAPLEEGGVSHMLHMPTSWPQTKGQLVPQSFHTCPPHSSPRAHAGSIGRMLGGRGPTHCTEQSVDWTHCPMGSQSMPPGHWYSAMQTSGQAIPLRQRPVSHDKKGGAAWGRGRYTHLDTTRGWAGTPAVVPDLSATVLAPRAGGLGLACGACTTPDTCSCLCERATARRREAQRGYRRRRAAGGGR